jgi:hypothetical protein
MYNFDSVDKAMEVGSSAKEDMEIHRIQEGTKSDESTTADDARIDTSTMEKPPTREVKIKEELSKFKVTKTKESKSGDAGKELALVPTVPAHEDVLCGRNSRKEGLTHPGNKSFRAFTKTKDFKIFKVIYARYVTSCVQFLRISRSAYLDSAV